MKELIVFLIVYGSVTTMTFMMISILIKLNSGIDYDFDEAVSDIRVRLIATMLLSVLWPITIPIIFINNLSK